MQTLNEIATYGSGVELGSGEPDVPVRPNQIERRLRNLQAREFSLVCRVVWNTMHLQQVTEMRGFKRGRGLAEHEKGKARVVEMLETSPR